MTLLNFRAICKMRRDLKIIAFLAILFLKSSICENPIVTINNGKVIGIINQTLEKNTTYYAFRAIPFAKPPTGDLRFRSPQRPNSWTGILNGTVDGADCLQLGNGGVVGSEDCLFINVYTPDTTMSRNLPVMVWIYGGTFITGSGSYATEKPDYFLEQEVIFVSFNYRVSALGWLSTEDENCPGNFGLKDQILALHWVQENIANFGGDSNNVTIFGESAGAASVSYLLQSNLTKGLFHKAIMESGTSLSLWALATNTRNRAFSLGVQLRIFTINDSKFLIDQMRKKRAADIINAAGNLLYFADLLTGLPWAPVIEPWSNESAFSGRSHDLLIEGKFVRVPLIIGYNSNELAGLGQLQKILNLLLIGYNLDYSRLPPYDLTTDNAKRRAAGTLIKNRYYGTMPLTADPRILIPFVNFDVFIRASREFANLTSLYTNVFFYRFNYGGSKNNGYWGAAHTDELQYLFVADGNTTYQDRIVRKRMVTLWANFAKYGIPRFTSSEDTLFPSNETTEWKPARMPSCTSPSPNCSLAATTDIQYLNITTNLFMATNPNETDYVFYRDEIFGRYGDGHYTTY